MKRFKPMLVALGLFTAISSVTAGGALANENWIVNSKSSIQSVKTSFRFDINSHLESDQFDVAEGETIKVTVVQWFSDSKATGKPKVSYKLYEINSTEAKGSKLIEGRYTNTNTSFEFPNLKKGKYYIKIINESNFAVAGNGYVE
ncbi:hypothetical protein ABER61_28820 [Brevibacillus formosus]|uniref:YtkA-like domain-containing protein n=1 Tax=Brevibacillus formosus TaxID=54913 RepID=A0A837KM00_9BACL|nr:hypothetical protein [Brevibacillus formosus]KLH98062.1 hypothetical protein AA984_13615 [Brevibacillus formosus]MED1960740.1 hypothetical protein [Brevibacillus formosus]PSJ87054.1 hypothetical protein C7R91_29085 [Brevibacillus formosus]GED61526.1 hypothetical protein BFO01nite_56580 [Brevibacillus formosus]